MTPPTEKIRILHVTPWFPTYDDPANALFIKRHVEALESFAEQLVLHIDLRMDGPSRPRFEEPGVISIRKKVPFRSWRLLEWMFYRTLRRELKRIKAQENFTHVNFHIAYPALIHYRQLGKYLPLKRLITEHWSAYHFNFHVKKKPARLSRMFHHKLPLLTVSTALADDIDAFAERRLDREIIPNVVDTQVFRYKNVERGDHFLIHALWKHPKEPLKLLDTIREMITAGNEITLRVGGYGPYWNEMTKFVEQHKLGDHITLLGKLGAEEFAAELNVARAFVMPSGYETFSVVTAEALCCGCPVIADNIGALSDLVNASNGVLREATSSWESVMENFRAEHFDRKKISEETAKRFSKDVVGRKYFELLSSL